MKFHEKYQDFTAFKNFLEELFELPFEQSKVTFIDAENEVIQISDSHDLEYFVDQFKEENFATIKLEKLADENEKKPQDDKELEFIELSQIEK